jgi:uncharacterized protein (TIGR03086 family)
VFALALPVPAAPGARQAPSFHQLLFVQISACLWRMDNPIALLDQGYAWTAARVAAVPADRLDASTPCSEWSLRELLDHMVGSLTMLTDAVDTDGAGDAPAASSWDATLAELFDRGRRAWQAPGVMDRTLETALGAMPAPMVASVTLLETLVHGWDIGQASGERADIPDDLARPVLEFARQAVGDAQRPGSFGPDLGLGGTPSEQLVGFLGRSST